MSASELMAVVSFGIMVLGAMFALWRYVESKISDAKEKAEKVAGDLAAHRLHVAEVYVSKQGLRETKDEIMEAIHGVKTAVDHMTVRVDRIVENQASKPRPRSV